MALAEEVAGVVMVAMEVEAEVGVEVAIAVAGEEGEEGTTMLVNERGKSETSRPEPRGVEIRRLREWVEFLEGHPFYIHR